jgi:hypothetical protein
MCPVENVETRLVHLPWWSRDGLWLGAKGNYTLENSLVSGIQRRMSSLA